MTNGLEKGMIYIPGGTERKDVRLYHATQNGAQFKTYELLISGIFYLVFSETLESEIAYGGETTVLFSS